MQRLMELLALALLMEIGRLKQAKETDLNSIRAEKHYDFDDNENKNNSPTTNHLFTNLEILQGYNK